MGIGKINCARDIPFGLCFYVNDYNLTEILKEKFPLPGRGLCVGISVRIFANFRAIPFCETTSGLSRDQIWARS